MFASVRAGRGKKPGARTVMVRPLSVWALAKSSCTSPLMVSPSKNSGACFGSTALLLTLKATQSRPLLSWSIYRCSCLKLPAPVRMRFGDGVYAGGSSVWPSMRVVRWMEGCQRGLPPV